MKCLTLVIHESAKQDLIDLIWANKVATGFTLQAGEGHSLRTGGNPFETDRDRVAGYVPRVRVDLLLEEEELARVLEHLQGCESCVAGRGIWWVTPVLASGKL